MSIFLTCKLLFLAIFIIDNFFVDKMIMRDALHVIFIAYEFWNLFPIFAIYTHSFLKPQMVIIRPFLFFIFARKIILTWICFQIWLWVIILYRYLFFLWSFIFYYFNFLNILVLLRIFIQSGLLFCILLKVRAALSRSSISNAFCN